MKKINPFFTIMLIIMILITTLSFLISKSINNEIDEAASGVGNEVALKNDTLMIINYSIIFQEYELENGQKISFEFYKKHKL